MTMRQQVLPEWVDYNGHLSEGYYVLVFGFATDALMDQVGMDADYLKRTGCSLYTVEAHVRYLREVPPDSEMLITTRVVEVGAKKLRLCHEMVVDDVLRATTELVALHVDSEQGCTSPFPEGIIEALNTRIETAPDYAGRV